MVGPILTHQKSPLPAKQWLPGLIRITHPRDRLCRWCRVQIANEECHDLAAAGVLEQVAKPPLAEMSTPLG
jgi:hypothetical protein